MAENPIKPVQIAVEEFQHASMDYERLKEEGMNLVQQLSGLIWTDYNPHDPGVTILEQLCFALTDLGYRTDFKIQDLLNARSRKRRKEINNTFYDASEALPTNPVSIQDYRVLIIDRVQYVRNAWIEVVRDNLQGINGLYRVMLQIDEAARNPENIKRIKEEVWKVFSQHRNLCEDLDSIHVLGVERVTVFAELDISTDGIAEEILANILFKLEEYLNPTVEFHTLEEMQAEGMSVDEIFEGPAPVHGFIKKSDLQPVRREIYVSKLIELISSEEGVRRINYFRVEKEGFPIEGDVIQIEDGYYPILDLDPIDDKYLEVHRYPVKFYRGSLHYELDLNTVNQLYSSLYARYRKGYQLEMLYNERDYPSALKQEEIPNYYSIQNFFPITYGLNRYGLPSNVRPTKERHGMIKQLKGYLIFFEQILANYLSQLANIKQLFSINEEVDKTYFSQVPMDIPGIHDIIAAAGDTPEKKGENFLPKLEAISAQFDPFIDRRNKFLDHLLARFGEQFLTDFLLKINQQDSASADKLPESDLILAKIAFLRHWVDISRNRSKAFDYFSSVSDGWNVSGLEKRTCLLLNIPQKSNESLVAYLSKSNIEGSEQVEGEDMERFDDKVSIVDPETKEGLLDLQKLQEVERKRAELSLQKRKQKEQDDQLDMLNNLQDGNLDIPSPDDSNNNNDSEDATSALPDEQESIDYTQRFVFRATSKTELLHELFAHGGFSYNYLLIPNRKKTYSIYYQRNQEKVYKVREADDYAQARNVLEEWVKYLAKLNRRCEGMHIIEHILLRPQAKDRYGFRLNNDQDKVLLVSYDLGDIEDQRLVTNELENFGIKAEYYSIIEHPGERFQILLHDFNKKPIATCPEEFYSREGAEEKRNDLVEHFQSFQDSRVPISNFISFFMEQRKESNVGQQFYSLNMSMVLPNYASRFQNIDFRNLLNATVAVNCPVHLHVNFYWLNFDEMQTFEKVYFDWLHERAKPEPQQPDLDDKAHLLIEMLKNFDKKAKAATPKK